MTSCPEQGRLWVFFDSALFEPGRLLANAAAMSNCGKDAFLCLTNCLLLLSSSPVVSFETAREKKLRFHPGSIILASNFIDAETVVFHDRFVALYARAAREV